MGLATISIVGQVGGDAETKKVGDTTVTEFSVAVGHVKGSGEDKEETTSWFRCKIWGPRGEKLEEFILKGKKVALTGSFESRVYEKDGEERTSLEVRVAEIDPFLAPKVKKSKSRDDDDEDEEEEEEEAPKPKKAAKKAAPKKKSADDEDDWG